jgi:translation initiation factor IF-1
MPERRTIKQLIGHDVAIRCHDGAQAHGHLLNANRRSVWLVTGDEDRFIQLTAISSLRRAS